jgi:hypothetical protein
MTEEELRVLAWTLLGEAAGEGPAGMAAVAHVIRNRAASGRFPDNPAAVALQSNSQGTHQFSTWNAITNGGNLPRARYPVGSESFNSALRIAEKVFGATPGADPTQGATHYYSPKGMKDGAAPYWWRSEARRGEKQIGGHIFAIKYDPKTAPTPATRSVDPVGAFPSKGQLELVRTGKAAQLPVIGATGGPGLTKPAPQPAKQSLAMIERRIADAPVVSSTTFIYDPVSQSLRPKTASASDLVRAAGKAGAAQPAKQVQSVAGFSVPGGTAGIEAVDRMRILQDQAPTHAGQEGSNKAKPKPVAISDKVRAAQKQFAPVDQERLPVGTGLEAKPLIQSGGLSRDAVDQRIAGKIAGYPSVVRKVAPVPRDPIQRPPVTAPAAARPPLRIVVQRDPVAEVVRESPKSLYYTDPVAFGKTAVSQSGDTSTGSQADAAAARASGNAWRESQARK